MAGAKEVSTDKVVTMEAKDWPANFSMTILANNMDEAVKIAQSCPTYNHYEGKVFVRVYQLGEMPKM